MRVVVVVVTRQEWGRGERAVSSLYIIIHSTRLATDRQAVASTSGMGRSAPLVVASSLAFCRHGPRAPPSSLQRTRMAPALLASRGQHLSFWSCKPDELVLLHQARRRKKKEGEGERDWGRGVCVSRARAFAGLALVCDARPLCDRLRRLALRETHHVISRPPLWSAAVAVVVVL